MSARSIQISKQKLQGDLVHNRARKNEL